MHPHQHYLMKMTGSFMIHPSYKFSSKHQGLSLPARVSPPVEVEVLPASNNSSVPPVRLLNLPRNLGSAVNLSTATEVDSKVQGKQVPNVGKRLYTEVENCSDGVDPAPAPDPQKSKRRRSSKAPKRLSDEQLGQTKKHSMETKAWSDVETWRLLLHHTMFQLDKKSTADTKKIPSMWAAIQNDLHVYYGMKNRSASGVKNRFWKLKKEPGQLLGLKELDLFSGSSSTKHHNHLKMCLPIIKESIRDLLAKETSNKNKKKNDCIATVVPKSAASTSLILRNEEKIIPSQNLFKTTGVVGEQVRSDYTKKATNEIQQVYESWVNEPLEIEYAITEDKTINSCTLLSAKIDPLDAEEESFLAIADWLLEA